MAKLPRLILPNTPHHITQRGNRKQMTFFDEGDYNYYLRNLYDLIEVKAVKLDAFCLMPNHIHLILTPPSRGSLISLVSELHQRYTRYLNFKKGWKGHLWQGRFFSVPLSPLHFENCIYYVESNPLRANIVKDIQSYKWVSRRTVETKMLDCKTLDDIRLMTRSGRPKGPSHFLDSIKDFCKFDPRPKKRGRKPTSSIS